MEPELQIGGQGLRLAVWACMYLCLAELLKVPRLWRLHRKLFHHVAAIFSLVFLHLICL